MTSMPSRRRRRSTKPPKHLIAQAERGAHLGAEWRFEGLCSLLVEADKDKYLNLWFAPENSTQAAEAASICSRCPVRKQCDEWATATGEPSGVWGGVPASLLQINPLTTRDTAYPRVNPYTTHNPGSPFHSDNLIEWDGKEEYDE